VCTFEARTAVYWLWKELAAAAPLAILDDYGATLMDKSLDHFEKLAVLLRNE
jgi:hypothetical protein